MATKTSKSAKTKPARKTAAKTAAKKPAAKKTAAKKQGASAGKKPAARRTTAKAAPKSAAAKKPAQKAASKKPAAKKTAAKKPAAKTAAKAPAKKAAAAKPAARKAAPAKPAPAASKPAPSKPAAKPSGAAPEKKAAKKTKAPAFKPDEFIVYPAHGVGRITAVEKQEVAGYELELFVITFEQDKMTLRVPTNKVESVGMRKLSGPTDVETALRTLKGRARIKRTMWSRRAQEYEAKINSGNLVAIAEVVRDLYRSEKQPEQSYSERQLYEAALDRMARELAAVEKTGEDEAQQKIEGLLAKSRGAAEKAEEEKAA